MAINYQTVSWGIILLIFGLAAYWAWRERQLSSRFFNELRTVRTGVDWLASRPSIADFEKLEIPTFSKQYFVTRTENGEDLLVSENGSYLLFTDVDELLPRLPVSPYRFVPALLTTAGVLGTFLGISLGLVDFNTENQDSTALLNSATSLLDGMKTAFYTSLAGLFASFTYMLILHRYAESRQSQYQSTRDPLIKLCATISPAHLLYRLSTAESADAPDEQTALLQQVARSNQVMARAAKHLEQVLTSFNGTEISNAVGEAVNKTVKEELAPVVKGIHQELEAIRSIKSDTNEEIVRLLTEAIRQDIVDPLGSEIRRLSEVTERSSSAIDSLITRLDEVMVDLAETTKVLNRFQQETLDKLEAFAESLSATLAEFKADTREVLEQVSQEMNAALAKSIEGMSAQRAAFEESAEKASTAFGEQNESLRVIGQEAGALMNEAKSNLIEGLANIDSKVAQMSSVVQQELEAFREEYQNNLNAFFESQNNLLEETLGSQREGLAAVVEQFKETFQQEHQLRQQQFAAMDEQHQKLKDGVSSVGQLVQAVGMTEAGVFSQLEDAAKAVSREVGMLRKQYGEASQRFNEITERMPEAMNDYFERAHQDSEAYFKELDHAAAAVHSRLAEAANLLVVAMQEVQSQSKALRRE